MGIDTRTPPLRRALARIGITLIVLSTVGYVGFQARNLIRGPRITLSPQSTATTTSHARLVTIEGSARNIVKLTFNDKEIHTDNSGAFSHTFMLEQGYSIITLTAEDRFGRVTSISRPYVYVATTTPADRV